MSGKFSSLCFVSWQTHLFFSPPRVFHHAKHELNFTCSVSKQQAIVPGQCYELEDGSSSFKDFHGSRNNRFASPEQAAKNRIQHPSNVLHFFNAQPDVTPELFSQVCIRKWTRCVYFRSQTFYSGSSALVLPHRFVKRLVWRLLSTSRCLQGRVSCTNIKLVLNL